MSTYTLTQNYNLQSVLLPLARLAYRAGWGIVRDGERIHAVLCRLYAILAAVVPVLLQALALVSIPALAMVAVLTVPGLPLCLVALVVFGFITWPRMAVRHG